VVESTSGTCVCPAGQTLDNGACTPCGASAIKTAAGNGVCSSCTGEKVANTARTECICPAGKTLVDSACASCTAGKYKAEAGNGECGDCPSGKSPSSDFTSCKDVDKDGDDWSAGKIAGVVIGCFFGLCLLILAIYGIYRLVKHLRESKSKPEQNDKFDYVG
jgi:hypothetical protein